MAIPDWELHVIPPVRPVPPEEQDLPENRSPYEATLLQLVERFVTTPERVKLLHDLMDYREALYGVGVTEGFQWINGSLRRARRSQGTAREGTQAVRHRRGYLLPST